MRPSSNWYTRAAARRSCGTRRCRTTWPNCWRGCAAVAELIAPDWPALPGVRAFVTTRGFGDMRRDGAGRARLSALVPAAPCWLRQSHGCTVAQPGPAGESDHEPDADAATTSHRGVVCAVLVADCMPVLLAGRTGNAVGVAHAGWRGLAAGVIEAALAAMRTDPAQIVAWLGPAIGPLAYEVGDEVRAAFLAADAAAKVAFVPSRPGHWRLDLYAIARQRLRARGVTQVSGGDFCTHAEADRFFSWRRERTPARMAAVIWLT
ncbi:MAG: peptidoglycan editing factor PgeF [Betaproteobacteria bacterium]|nr:MAG: peptidoglycan editing factor PgeF [Betaproteobacteria bacterium]